VREEVSNSLLFQYILSYASFSSLLSPPLLTYEISILGPSKIIFYYLLTNANIPIIKGRRCGNKQILEGSVFGCEKRSSASYTKLILLKLLSLLFFLFNSFSPSSLQEMQFILPFSFSPSLYHLHLSQLLKSPLHTTSKIPF